MRVLFAALLAVAVAVSPAKAEDAKTFSQAELDQALAPVALYPDALLSQVLMAATYPLEIVEAARWSKAHPGIQGDEGPLWARGEQGMKLRSLGIEKSPSGSHTLLSQIVSGRPR